MELMAEFDSLPEQWEMKRLGEIARFRTGPFGSALHKSDYVNDGVPIINPMHIVDGTVEPTSQMTISEELAVRLSDFRLKAGEIVIGRRGDMGRCAVVQPDQAGWLCGTGSMIIRLEELADTDFFQRVLSSPRAISAIVDASVGTTMVNLNQETLASLWVQFPPLEEQRAISTALRDVDELVKGLERLIAKKRDLKQAAMQQLLTGQTRLLGFSDNWEQQPLDKLCAMKSGNAITSADIDQYSDYPCYGGNGLRGYTSHFTHDGMYVLIGRQGALCGNVFGAEGQFFASEHAIVVTPSADSDVRWLTYALKRMNLNQYSESSAQPGLSVSKLLKLEVFAPPTKDEQSAISTVLADMDNELAAFEQRLAKTRDLKQAMMQELLTGKTRLVTSEAIHA